MSEKRNASAPAAASPPNAADARAAKQSVTSKRSANATVGARHAVPERPASKAQPSSTTSRRRANALSRAASNASSPKKRSRTSKRKRSKLASPAAIDNAVTQAFGDGTIIAAASPTSRAAKASSRKLKSPSPARAAKSSAPAAPIDAQPVSAAPLPRIRIGDAMRRSGLDEYKVARTFAGVVDKLSDGTKDTGGVQKLLVDVLKECSRHLDPPQSERAAPAPVIALIHNVPRPVRAQTQSSPPQPQLNAAPEAAQSSEVSDASK